jgi:hypothetical protein
MQELKLKLSEELEREKQKLMNDLEELNKKKGLS